MSGMDHYPRRVSSMPEAAHAAAIQLLGLLPQLQVKMCLIPVPRHDAGATMTNVMSTAWAVATGARQSLADAWTMA